MKKLTEARDPRFIVLLAGALDAEKIDQEVMSTVKRGQTATMLEMWIQNDEDFTKAESCLKELIENYKLDLELRKNAPEVNSDPAVAWKCQECGEELEGQFTSCWNCGKSKPGFETRTGEQG